ncbi:MAG: hypothetical protein NTX63_02525 [Candidatus Peregrinibacteria bacterium]|nr:hypothetical protein [Candidatus Peregrinibacteria bacterium]
MNKEIIWDFLIQTAFFQSLARNSQEKLQEKWASFSNDQFIEILRLVGLEQVIIDFIMDETKPIISIAKKNAEKLLRMKLEKANRIDEDTNLAILLDKIS